MDLANAQWFSQLTLMANKVPVLNVSRGDDGFGSDSMDGGPAEGADPWE